MIGVFAFQIQSVLIMKLPNIDFHIVSPGGMGCSFVIDQIALKALTNARNDSDGLKHHPYPEKLRLDESSAKVVYVWNDPLRAILSLHRRGWLSNQCLKLNGMQFASNSIEKLWDTTVIYGLDVFGISEHARSWAEFGSFQMFFLDLRAIEGSKEELQDFLGFKIPDLVHRERTIYETREIPTEVQRIYAELDSGVRKRFQARLKLRIEPLIGTRMKSDVGSEPMRHLDQNPGA